MKQLPGALSLSTRGLAVSFVIWHATIYLVHYQSSFTSSILHISTSHQIKKFKHVSKLHRRYGRENPQGSRKSSKLQSSIDDQFSSKTLTKTLKTGREIPIVHCVIKLHERQDTGEVEVLTKGDNNYGDDRLLYAQGQLWLQRHHIMGRAVGFLQYVGWVTIIMTEKPIIKYILIGALGLLVINSKE